MNIQLAIDAGLAVQFVYDSCKPANFRLDLTGNAVPISGRQYVVTNTLYANDLATGISPGLQDYVTIGIIAVNTADPLDIYVAIRGTDSVWEWIQDCRFLPKPFPRVPGGGYTEDGFTDMYLSMSMSPSPHAGDFVADIYALCPAKAKITVAGHSLGAALATLLAMDMAAHAPEQDSSGIALFTLASPRVGDLSFMQLFNHIVANAYRIENRLDIVPKTPPPLLYFHVGDETELIPSKQMKFDIVCEHHLPNYLNMLASTINLPGYPIAAECLRTPPAAIVEVDT